MIQVYGLRPKHETHWLIPLLSDMSNPLLKLAKTCKDNVYFSMDFRANRIWLVVWNMTVIFTYIGNFILPID